MVAFAIFKGYPKRSAAGLLLKRGIRPGTIPPEEDLRKNLSARVKTPEKKIAGRAEKILPQLHCTGALKNQYPRFPGLFLAPGGISFCGDPGTGRKAVLNPMLEIDNFMLVDVRNR
jgi:hypothetical protein